MSRYVPVVSPLSRRNIEQDAIRITARFYPDLLQEPGRFPVLEFFDHVLRDVYRLDPGVELLSDGVEGMTWPDGRVLVSADTYRGAHDGIGRPRFTVVHECYHGIKHRRQIQKALVDAGELVLYRRTKIKPYVDPEWQANTFASAVLMPEAMVRRIAAMEHRMLLVGRMAEVFGVSPKAAEVRLAKLGLQ
jgi:hypothetical protein